MSKGFNPLCGDEITVYLEVRDAVVHDIKIEARGCSISVASGSVMSERVKSQSTKMAKEIRGEFSKLMLTGDGDPRELGDVVALAGVAKFPVRIKCAALAWDTLDEALDVAANEAMNTV
jgi:nitrogen fixation NifU-like protein